MTAIGPSITKLNSMGLRGHPCFIPLVMVLGVKSPSSVLSNPARSIMVNRVVCGIDLNAS